MKVLIFPFDTLYFIQENDEDYQAKLSKLINCVGISLIVSYNK